MGDCSRVAVTNGSDDLQENASCTVLFEVLVVDYIVKQLPPAADFQGEVERIHVVENLIQSNDVWVVLFFYYYIKAMRKTS